MVRTRRSIEEEARVRLIRESGCDTYVSDPIILKKLYGELLEEIYSFGGEADKTSLVVGCEENGEIAINLARRGMFVVVVDDSKERLERVKARSQEEKLFLRMTFFEIDYMRKEFTGGSFDFITLFSVLGRYNEPITVVRKCKRELKVGGKIFLRMKVEPLLPSLPGFLERLGFVKRLRTRFNSLLFKEEAFESVREKIASEFKIVKIATGRRSPQDFLSLKKKTFFASFFCLKELELGKTFRV